MFLIRTFTFFITVILFFLVTVFKTQAQEEKSSYSFFVEPEWMVGKIVPNYSDFPKSESMTTFYLNLGITDNSSDHCSRFYNFPSIGLSFSAANLGNDSILGNSYSVLPFITIKPFPEFFKYWYLKFGLGASYFSSYYKSNQYNKVIGSRLNWAFQAFLYRDLWMGRQMQLKLGAGYLHSSNGHTQIPNYGLNSAMLSLACRFNSKPVASKPKSHFWRNENLPGKLFFLNFRSGAGLHELGGPVRPIGGPKRPVYSSALSGGILFNKHVKVRTGFTYRFYEQYYNYITENETPEYIKHPVRNASNIYFLLGCEFLLGHFGMDMEGGLNLYKPFYKEHAERYGKPYKFKHHLKKLFVSRMGLNYYIINTSKFPRNNFFIGANINANFGQADFSELSIGYTYTFM